MSRPSRARGLKQTAGQPQTQRGGVAPLAGAWIETSRRLGCHWSYRVAPLAGAWIETYVRRNVYLYRNVAPLAGAWIETKIFPLDRFILYRSRPSRARGLKLVIPCQEAGTAWSRPSRARGLKQSFVHCSEWQSLVAPLAGAWIETSLARRRHMSRTSRPSRARGLKRLITTS